MHFARRFISAQEKHCFFASCPQVPSFGADAGLVGKRTAIIFITFTAITFSKPKKCVVRAMAKPPIIVEHELV